MALIPDDPKQRNALVVGVVALAGFYFFWSMWYSPRAEQNLSLETRLEQLERENLRAQNVATRGTENLEERLALYERHMIQLEQLIPDSEEVPRLLDQIMGEARRHRVDLGSIRPEPEEVGMYYTKSSYEYQVNGEYHDVGRFLASIASLPRIITPVDLELGPFTGTQPLDLEWPVSATLRVETFLLPATDAAPEMGGVVPEGGATGGGR